MTKPMQNMSAEEFDEYFDDGGDISELFTEQATTRPNLDTKKVNVDFTLRSSMRRFLHERNAVRTLPSNGSRATVYRPNTKHSGALRDEAPHLGHCQLPRNAIRGLPGILRRASS